MNHDRNIRYRPHDLVWVTSDAALSGADTRPAWATPEWLTLAPVVVRRAISADADHVPVGLRGTTRSERWATHVAPRDIVRSVTPEDIACIVPDIPKARAATVRCLQVLMQLAPELDRHPLSWGVTGSVGFTLASGCDVLRADSDLDLIVRAPLRSDASALRAILELLNNAVIVDVQVDTGRGAFALKEWMRTGGPVLLKTNTGPLLCADPWDVQTTER